MDDNDLIVNESIALFSNIGYYGLEDVAWKYNEDRMLTELKQHCADTYGEHYAKGKIESSEFIADQGYGIGFFLGNVIKYAARYGKKEGYNKIDLYKAGHYLLMAMNEHDKASKEKGS